MSGRLLGNFPQAFSHVPLINTAMHLSAAGPDPRRLRFEDGTGITPASPPGAHGRGG